MFKYAFAISLLIYPQQQNMIKNNSEQHFQSSKRTEKARTAKDLLQAKKDKTSHC